MKKKVVIYTGNEDIHLTQVYTALGLLQQQKRITVSIKKDRDFTNRKCFVRCEIDGRKIVFELHDRIQYFDKACYEWCDYYLKRNIDHNMMQQYPKMLPLGLNVIITSKHDFSTQRSLHANTTKTFLKTFLNNSVLLSRILKLKNGRHITDCKHLFQLPIQQNNPKIIFIPRLWDHNRVTGQKREEWKAINEERITYVQILKNNFPKHFIGGLEPNAFSINNYPDFTLSPKYTYKLNYLNLLRDCSIGISTVGLANSIPWKFGEYMLFSKAIVSNNIDDHLLNAPIFQTKNYLAFSKADSLLEQVEKLVTDHDFRMEMMHNNYEYAKAYLRPDKQIAGVLLKLGIAV
jgi:hypothetical protein